MFPKQIFTVFCFLLIAMSIGAEVPNVVSYQGRLTDAAGDPVADGPFLVKFIIYDAAEDGNEIWNSTFQTINTVGGVFSYQLGSNITLPAGIFSDPNRYLGITVGTDSEIIPRTQFVTTSYAFKAENADVAIDANSLGGAVPSYYLDWSNLTNVPADIADGDDERTDSDILSVVDPLYSPILHAHDKTTIDDEPGVASNNYNYTITLTTTMQTLTAVTITTPGPGYIYIVGRCWNVSSGSTANTTSIFQIDETAGGSVSIAYAMLAGANIAVDASLSIVDPVFVDRMYYKSSSGSYTFLFEAMKQFDEAYVYAGRFWITAFYYPTSYGSVSTVSIDPNESENAKMVNSTDLNGNAITTYQYDLRELEERVRQAEIEKQKAELRQLQAQNELEKARLENKNEQ